MDRLLAAALAEPGDDLTFERLRNAALREQGSLTPLEAALRAGIERRREATAHAQLLARLLAESERWSEAHALLGEAIERAREPAGALLLRARLAREAGRAGEAGEDLRKLLDLRPEARRPERVAARRALGELALAADALEEARLQFAELARLGAPVDAFARALAARGRHELAATEYRVLVEGGAASRQLPLLLALAREELASGDAVAALATIERGKALPTASQRAELRALEHEAMRALGRLDELARRLEHEARAGRAAAWSEAFALYRELGDEARMRACLQAWVARSPDDLRARAELAASLERAGESAAAERAYRELHRRAPREPAYLVALAELLQRAGRRDEALALLATAAARGARDVRLHDALRLLYLRWGEQALAARALERLAALDPQNEAHAVALAERALAAGDRKAALSTFLRLRKDTGDPRAAARLARVLGEHDLLPEAIEHAERAVALSRGADDTQRLLAGLLERAGRDVEAEAAWRAALERPDADDAARREARQHIAVLLRRTGKLAQRTSALEQALRESPDDLEAMRFLAELYARDPDKLGQQIALLERLIAQAPRDREALRALEQAQLQRGDVAAAMRVVSTRLALERPSESEVLRALELARERPLGEEPLRLAARAREAGAASADVQRALGDLFAARGEDEPARAAYARAVELDAHQFAARYALAERAIARGELAQAREQLEAIALGAGDEELATAALDLLMAHSEDVVATLARLARKSPKRAALRRAWLTRAVDPLLPALALAREGGTLAESVEKRLRALVGAESGLLLAALTSDDRTERGRALALLELIPHAPARDALLALAERRDGSLEERARALLALGLQADAAAAPRLRRLLERAGRHLRPFALWSLAQSLGRGATSELIAALTADEPSAVVAALALGGVSSREASGPLTRAATHGAPVLRVAAAWALARSTAAAAPPLRIAAQGAPLEATAALSLGAADPAVLADALLGREAALRQDAVRLLEGDLRRATTIAPFWPYDPTRYARAVMVATSAPPARPTAATLAEVVLARLRSGTGIAAELALLAPVPFGIAPRAYAEQGVCFEQTMAAELGARLRPRLAELAQSSERAARLRALPLLVAAGGLAQPALLAALASRDRDTRDAALEAAAVGVAGGQALTSALHAAVTRIFAGAREWPTRMRAARLLRPTLTPDQLAREPIALVRSAVPPRPTPICAAAEGVAN